jgi:prohibitin 2
MENPSVLDLQVVERWDGIVPMVVGPRADGADMLLPIKATDLNGGIRP